MALKWAVGRVRGDGDLRGEVVCAAGALTILGDWTGLDKRVVVGAMALDGGEV